jgi:hypothetical protein
VTCRLAVGVAGGGWRRPHSELHYLTFVPVLDNQYLAVAMRWGIQQPGAAAPARVTIDVREEDGA